jgi:hypothetical protein
MAQHGVDLPQRRVVPWSREMIDSALVGYGARFGLGPIERFALHFAWSYSTEPRPQY